jgi:hypothetical protein
MNNNFSQEIQNFKRYGNYTYKFDNSGNIIFNSSSKHFDQVYLALPLENLIYDNSKIKTMYNVEFEEFVPNAIVEIIKDTSDIKDQIDIIQQENSILKSQLEAIIGQNETNGSVADEMAAKQVILELRKTVGQGRVDSDFSNTFPYTSIKKTNI